MRLSSLLNPKLVRCGLSAQTKEEALAEVARILAAAEPSLTEAELLAALAEREKLGPFSMGKGIAFPHARTEKVKDFSIVLGTSPAGLDFRAPDGHKVHIVILFAIPKKHSNLYLHTLAAFLNFFTAEGNLKRVLEAKSGEELIAAIDALSVRGRETVVPQGPGFPTALTPQTTVAKALETLSAARGESLPVLDAEGNLVGELTSAAILQLALRDHLLALSAPGVLSPGPSLEKALRQHADSPVHTVPGLVATNGFRTVQEDDAPLQMAAALAQAGRTSAYILRGTKLVGTITAAEILRRLGATRPAP
ncbi:MAG TPA: PTS sugar transporter subunit IIA [Planctomycetota bacterium]|jgi:mannitol/fructose-specific phosphotransferase system IIA component (Ntr-type)